MANFHFWRVMVSAYISLMLVTLFSSTFASLCPEKQYFNSKLQLCMNCTDCADGSVVLRPCEIHRDTYCGPFSELLKSMLTGNPHRHHHVKHHHQKHHENEEIEWRYGNDVKGDSEGEPIAAAALEVTSSEAPFSSAETIVWDWQAMALTSAVFACILFFLVITLYSFHQARQWRRLKDNFEADVEELSARLSLMAASTSSEKSECLEGTGVVGLCSSTDINYLNNRCVYLEQLLSVRKEDSKTGTKSKGNVYIEENKHKT